MFPSPSSASPLPNSLDQRNPHDRNSLPHLTNSQSNMGFSAGTTLSGSSAYSSWAGGATGGHMNDPFAPSRSHYQPGFLMSMTQGSAAPPGGQHIEDPPLIPTKFDSSNPRTSPSEFGLESMFEHPRRQRQPPNDEDAPPTTSVNDIMEEPHVGRFQPRASHSGSPLAASAGRRPVSSPQQTAPQQPVTYLNIFGYPSDRYENIARLFQSLGDTTDPEPSVNGMWFTIGFRQAWEAERALRRNGKIMDDAYMIGVARAHSPGTDTTLDAPRTGPPLTSNPILNNDTLASAKDSLVQSNRSSAANTLGMPLTLAPSTAAFKPAREKAANMKESGYGHPSAQQQPQQAQTSAFSKISDMIFGW